MIGTYSGTVELRPFGDDRGPPKLFLDTEIPLVAAIRDMASKAGTWDRVEVAMKVDGFKPSTFSGPIVALEAITRYVPPSAAGDVPASQQSVEAFRVHDGERERDVVKALKASVGKRCFLQVRFVR